MSEPVIVDYDPSTPEMDPKAQEWMGCWTIPVVVIGIVIGLPILGMEKLARWWNSRSGVGY